MKPNKLFKILPVIIFAIIEEAQENQSYILGTSY